MTQKARRAAIAATAPTWRSAFTEGLLGQGFDVHTASTAGELFDLLRKHTYHALVLDASLDDMELIEAALTAVDLSPGRPDLVVSGVQPPELRPVMSWCNIRFAGPRERALAWLRDSGLSDSNGAPGSARGSEAPRGPAPSRTQPPPGSN